MIKESIITDTLLKKGVKPESITSEGMLQSILNGIKKEEAMIARSKAEAQKNLATVMDLKGRKIRPGAQIMGGEEVVETEAQIAERLGKGNKQAVENIKEKQLIESFDPDEMATGGRAGYFIGGKVGAGILKLLKNKKKVKEAVDNIFPTGDYKYDAQMAAESLVENNPKVFGGKLMEDLDDATRSEVYGTVIGPIQQNALMVSRMKRASKPTKTLEGIKKTGIIDISDPDIAEEFTRFMKETDPKGSKVIEQTVELSNFNPKGRKKNATGGRAGFKSGSYLMDGLRSLGKKYKGSTTQAILENPKLLGAELGHDGIMELMNLLPGLFAKGGRAGFAGGGMGRRAFLKLMAALGATGVAAKSGLATLLKGGGKQVAKGITIPKTSGMPDWFEPLVNRVIKDGEDMTKSFATKEREIVNATKIGDDEMVTVYRDLDDGTVRVEYQSLDNLAEGPVQLEFKPGMADETTKGKKPPDEFKASESEPEIVNWDGDIEGTGENLVDNVADLTSDTTKLKEYAVGKEKITIKEMVESIKKKKRTQKINEDPVEQINYIENKEGYSPMEYIDESERVGAFKNTGPETKGMNLPQKKASGGIARMLGE
jgi:hypothetical protein